MIRRAALAVALVVSIAGAPTAYAFRDGDTFDLPIDEGGAGCQYSNGSPRYKGYTCASCHVRTCNERCHDRESKPGTLKFDKDDGIKLDELFAGDQWEPGRSYSITIALKGKHVKPGEHERDFFNRDAFSAGTGINYAGFTMEVIDDRGEAVGTFDPGEGSIALDGGAVIATSPKTNRRAWTFTYTAPPAGTGRLTVYFAAVASIGAAEDDDEGGGRYVRAIDFTDDDVFVMDPVIACEAGTSCDRTPPVLGGEPYDSPAHRYGCSAAAHPSRYAPTALIWLILASARRRRRSPRVARPENRS